MALYAVKFTHVGNKKSVPQMVLQAETLDGLAQRLEKELAPYLHARSFTVNAKPTGEVTVTAGNGYRVGTGHWRRDR